MAQSCPLVPRRSGRDPVPLIGEFSLHKRKRTKGLEPSTPGLGSQKGHYHPRGQTATDACIHAGFRALEASEAAWLREAILRRLGRYWATEDRGTEARSQPQPGQLASLLSLPRGGDTRAARRSDSGSRWAKNGHWLVRGIAAAPSRGYHANVALEPGGSVTTTLEEGEHRA